MNKKWIIWIVGSLLIFPIINFYIPFTNLPEDAELRIQTLSEQNEDDLDFIKAAYQDINQRITSEERCWKTYWWRNYITSGEEIWDLQGECLPCHQQNKLLQAYLIGSNRFTSDQLKLIVTKCPGLAVLHTHTEIDFGGKIIKVDQWGRTHNGVSHLERL